MTITDHATPAYQADERHPGHCQHCGYAEPNHKQNGGLCPTNEQWRMAQRARGVKPPDPTDRLTLLELRIESLQGAVLDLNQSVEATLRVLGEVQADVYQPQHASTVAQLRGQSLLSVLSAPLTRSEGGRQVFDLDAAAQQDHIRGELVGWVQGLAAHYGLSVDEMHELLETFRKPSEAHVMPLAPKDTAVRTAVGTFPASRHDEMMDAMKSERKEAVAREMEQRFLAGDYSDELHERDMARLNAEEE